MKLSRKLALIVLSARCLAVPIPDGIAQTVEDPIEVARSVIKANRQMAVTQAMQFTANEARDFWPVYHQYRAEMDKVGGGIKALVVDYARLYPEVPDDRARKMLKDLADLEKKQVAIRTSYLKKIGKVLPAAKTLRFAQVESRLDLAVRLELAANVPLVPIEGKLTGGATIAAAYAEGVAGGVIVQTLEITARVAAINHASRKVTLVSPDGIKQTVKVGPEAINFDQIRVGDQLKVTATEELVVEMGKPGESADDRAAAVVALAPKGAKPGGLVAETTQISGTVTAIDATKRTATLRFEDGSTKTLPVRSDVDLGKRKVGDQVVFRITEMIAVSVEKP
jgi:hypothetical protein